VVGIVTGIGRVAFRLWPVVLVIAVWQAWVSLGDVQRIVAPTPLEVAENVRSQPGIYLSNIGLTLLHAASGLLVGMAVGSLIALFCWFSPLLRGLLTPGAVLLQSVPLVAVVPIMALILGYEPKTVVGVAALLTFFPAFVFVSSGLRATPDGSDDLFRVLGASRSTVLRRLAVPSAVPNVLTALRLCASIVIIAAIIGESLMGVDGLGKMFSQSFQLFDTPKAWGASLMIVTLSVLAYGLSGEIERTTRRRRSL
jgi:ABC-type nitrate/sulfonate/bicarbonate transport system permease component